MLRRGRRAPRACPRPSTRIQRCRRRTHPRRSADNDAVADLLRRAAFRSHDGSRRRGSSDRHGSRRIVVARSARDAGRPDGHASPVVLQSCRGNWAVTSTCRQPCRSSPRLRHDSDAIWVSQFGSDPGIVNRQILLDDQPHTVIGVLPRGGAFDRAFNQIWRPLAFEPSNMTGDFHLARVVRPAEGRRLARAGPIGHDAIGARIGLSRLQQRMGRHRRTLRRHADWRRHAPGSPRVDVGDGSRAPDRLRPPRQSRAHARPVPRTRGRRARITWRPAWPVEQKAITAAIHSVRKDQAITDIRTVDQIRDVSMAGRRLQSVLLGVFGAVALVLAGLGVYGVISYSVAQRTREMGIRAALGASKPSLLRLVLNRGAWLTASWPHTSRHGVRQRSIR
jgi:FtsX-like permease family protein